ncbi:hypothetical protein RchiOBHm_Chr6g0293451 [Rosa chinensis]|uniref:Uncharacterized protein n=1 Tax=Rosa chinensis TaxID=74649 RepID=A0A2P6PWM7_ROSCH|nr:hypothetical protein RchiOBHm_Chr6g0293451 [Rosa chinensis]
MVLLLLCCGIINSILGGEIPSEIRKMGSVEEVQKFDEIAKQPMSEEISRKLENAYKSRDKVALHESSNQDE